MFDFAWSEIGLIGLVAVLVLGPKELPQAMRAMGRFTRQARKLAGEFQSHVNDLIREAELDDVKRTVDHAATINVGAEIDKLLSPGAELGPELDESLARAEAEMRAKAATTPAVSPPVASPAAVPAPSPDTPLPHASPRAPGERL
jgi:sec-independent protein translocase protein TatB